METLTSSKDNIASENAGISMDTLVNYIHKTLPNTKDFFTEKDDSGKKRWVVINCSNGKTLFEIASLLEKEPYYGKRISVSDKKIHVSYLEKPQIIESFLLIKKFFSLLKGLFSGKGIPIEIITPAIVVASCKGMSEIRIKLSNPSSLDSFVSKINKNWYPDIKEKDIVFIFVTKEQIEKFATENKVCNIVDEKPTVTPIISTTINIKKDEAISDRVYKSRDYDDFHFLPFNRKRKKRHTNKIVASIKRFGVLSFCTVVITDCIDGVKRKYIVDGQHRFDAFVILGEPILYVLTEANSKEEIIQLIAELNSTSKNWSLRQYLNVWNSLGISQYTILEEYLSKTKLPFTVLLEIFSGLNKTAASKSLQDGKFQIKNLETAKKHIQWILELKNLLPKSRDILFALVLLFRKTEEYDNNRMRNLLVKTQKVFFYPGETLEQILTKLEDLYLKETSL